MELAYAAADLVVSRAGAGSISELAFARKMVILVPSPNVAEDHQMKNAESLVKRDAAMMIPDHRAGEELVNLILKMLPDHELQEKLCLNISKTGYPDAAGKIAELIYQLSGK